MHAGRGCRWTGRLSSWHGSAYLPTAVTPSHLEREEPRGKGLKAGQGKVGICSRPCEARDAWEPRGSLWAWNRAEASAFPRDTTPTFSILPARYGAVLGVQHPSGEWRTPARLGPQHPRPAQREPGPPLWSLASPSCMPPVPVTGPASLWHPPGRSVLGPAGRLQESGAGLRLMLWTNQPAGST